MLVEYARVTKWKRYVLTYTGYSLVLNAFIWIIDDVLMKIYNINFDVFDENYSICFFSGISLTMWTLFLVIGNRA